MNALLSRLSILNKLAILTVASILGLLAVSGYMAFDAKQHGRLAREKEVHNAVQSTLGILAWAQQQEASGKLTKEQAQELAKQAITDKPFNRLKASIAPLIGHHPCAKIFVILTTA